MPIVKLSGLITATGVTSSNFNSLPGCVAGTHMSDYRSATSTTLIANDGINIHPGTASMNLYMFTYGFNNDGGSKWTYIQSKSENYTWQVPWDPDRVSGAFMGWAGKYYNNTYAYASVGTFNPSPRTGSFTCVFNDYQNGSIAESSSLYLSN